MPNTIEKHKLYKLAEVAEILGCSTANLYTLMKSKRIAVISVGASGKGYRISGQDLLDFIDSSKTGGPAPRGTLKHIKLS